MSVVIGTVYFSGHFIMTWVAVKRLPSFEARYKPENDGAVEVIDVVMVDGLAVVVAVVITGVTPLIKDVVNASDDPTQLRLLYPAPISRTLIS